MSSSRIPPSGVRPRPGRARAPASAEGTAARQIQGALRSGTLPQGLASQVPLLSAIREPDPEKRQRQVLRCYIGQVLQNVQGLPAAEQAQFGAIVDRVTDAMLAEPSLASTIRQVCEQITRQAGKPARP